MVDKESTILSSENTQVTEEQSFNERQDFINSVKEMLKSMMGYSSVPVQLKGTQSQVNSFVKALRAERDFMESYRDYGPNNLRTNRSKIRAEQEAAQFERTMGITWPFR